MPTETDSARKINQDKLDAGRKKLERFRANKVKKVSNEDSNQDKISIITDAENGVSLEGHLSAINGSASICLANRNFQAVPQPTAPLNRSDVNEIETHSAADLSRIQAGECATDADSPQSRIAGIPAKRTDPTAAWVGDLDEFLTERSRRMRVMLSVATELEHTIASAAYSRGHLAIPVGDGDCSLHDLVKKAHDVVVHLDQEAPRPLPSLHDSASDATSSQLAHMQRLADMLRQCRARAGDDATGCGGPAPTGVTNSSVDDSSTSDTSERQPPNLGPDLPSPSDSHPRKPTPPAPSAAAAAVEAATGIFASPFAPVAAAGENGGGDVMSASELRRWNETAGGVAGVEASEELGRFMAAAGGASSRAWDFSLAARDPYTAAGASAASRQQLGRQNGTNGGGRGEAAGPRPRRGVGAEGRPGGGAGDAGGGETMAAVLWENSSLVRRVEAQASSLIEMSVEKERWASERAALARRLREAEARVGVVIEEKDQLKASLQAVIESLLPPAPPHPSRSAPQAATAAAAVPNNLPLPARDIAAAAAAAAERKDYAVQAVLLPPAAAAAASLPTAESLAAQVGSLPAGAAGVPTSAEHDAAAGAGLLSGLKAPPAPCPAEGPGSGGGRAVEADAAAAGNGAHAAPAASAGPRDTSAPPAQGQETVQAVDGKVSEATAGGGASSQAAVVAVDAPVAAVATSDASGGLTDSAPPPGGGASHEVPTVDAGGSMLTEAKPAAPAADHPQLPPAQSDPLAVAVAESAPAVAAAGSEDKPLGPSTGVEGFAAAPPMDPLAAVPSAGGAPPPSPSAARAGGTKSGKAGPAGAGQRRPMRACPPARAFPAELLAHPGDIDLQITLKHLQHPPAPPAPPPVLLSMLDTLWGVVSLRPVRHMILGPGRRAADDDEDPW